VLGGCFVPAALHCDFNHYAPSGSPSLHRWGSSGGVGAQVPDLGNRGDPGDLGAKALGASLHLAPAVVLVRRGSALPDHLAVGVFRPRFGDHLAPGPFVTAAQSSPWIQPSLLPKTQVVLLIGLVHHEGWLESDTFVVATFTVTGTTASSFGSGNSQLYAAGMTFNCSIQQSGSLTKVTP
jgi:hypothetical protein